MNKYKKYDTRDILFCIVGKSGSGKSSIAEKLKNDYNYKVLESYTTRAKRTPNETGHTFISNHEFEKLDNIVAYTEWNGIKYAATKEQIDNSDVYIVDESGVYDLYSNYLGNKKICVIYLEVSLPRRLFRCIKDNGVINGIKRVRRDKNKFNTVKLIADNIFLNNKKGDIDLICRNLATQKCRVKFIKALECIEDV
jgi:guanylate kinase